MSFYCIFFQYNTASVHLSSVYDFIPDYELTRVYGFFYQSCGVILSPKWTLLRLRLTLADVCLAILEEHCEEIVNRALVKDKTIAEIAIEDFMRSIPETNSIEQVVLA